jgi:hypothetical protein
VRRIWYLLSKNARRVVEKAEQYADGGCSLQTLRRATERLCKTADSAGDRAASLLGAYPATNTSLSISTVAECVSFIRRMEENTALVDLTREMFGNPFRTVCLEPTWLMWNDGAVQKMAQAIYDGRRFADLPILADALEDAGCADADILTHCRTPGEHVRGCWVIDLLLGKS